MVAFDGTDVGKMLALIGPGTGNRERRCRVDSVNVGGSTVTYSPQTELGEPITPVQQVNIPFASVTSRADWPNMAGTSPGVGPPNGASFGRNRQIARAFDRAVRNGGRAGPAAAIRADRARQQAMRRSAGRRG